MDLLYRLMPALVPLAVLALVAPGIALVHELGHALTARPAGYRVTSFGVGRGRPILRLRGPGGVLLSVRLWVLLGGTCVAIPRGPGVRRRAALFHAGGAIAQLLLAAVLLVFDGPTVELVARFNLLVLAWNLLPWRVAGHASDGWWIVRSLRGVAGGPGLLIRRRGELERLLAWEQAQSSPVGTWYARLLLAWIDLQVRRLDRADTFFVEEHPEAVLDGPMDALHHALVAEWHRLHGRPLAALWVLRQVRAARGDDLPPETEDLLCLAEGRTWLELGEAARARAALARLAGVAGFAGPDARVLRLELALAEEDLVEVEAAVSRIRVAHGLLDPVAALAALRQAAALLDGAAAEQARATAEALSERLESGVDAAMRADLDDAMRELPPAASGAHRG
jgi:hypothetical protein